MFFLTVCAHLCGAHVVRRIARGERVTFTFFNRTGYKAITCCPRCQQPLQLKHLRPVWPFVENDPRNRAAEGAPWPRVPIYAPGERPTVEQAIRMIIRSQEE